MRGLSSDSDYLAGLLDTISGPIVIVGHSYGGAVITNAATGEPDVEALVYVNAFAPDQGETVVQFATARPGSAIVGDPVHGHKLSGRFGLTQTGRHRWILVKAGDEHA